jgi:hypothetical protein
MAGTDQPNVCASPVVDIRGTVTVGSACPEHTQYVERKGIDLDEKIEIVNAIDSIVELVPSSVVGQSVYVEGTIVISGTGMSEMILRHGEDGRISVKYKCVPWVEKGKETEDDMKRRLEIQEGMIRIFPRTDGKSEEEKVEIIEIIVGQTLFTSILAMGLS